MIRFSALFALLLALGGPVAAQDTPAPTPAQVAVPGPEEFLALNVYLGQQDQAAVDAELRRLQLKYPGWQPPADLSRLSKTSPSTEIDEIYARIAAGQTEAARAQIAATEAEYAGWVPPEDMLFLIGLAEGQKALDTALDVGDAARALRIAADTSGLLRCDRVNNAWRIADLQAGEGQVAAALTTYRAVLAACTDPATITATLEKADAVADAATLAAMVDQAEARFPDRKADLDALRARLLAGHAPAVPEAIAPAEKPATGPALRPAARPALPAASAPAAPGGGGGAGSVAAAARAGDWARCLALSEGARSAAVLYERAWCAFSMDRTMEALAAFKAASAGGLNATQRRDAQYGMALAYLRMNMPDEAAAVAASTDLKPDQRLDVERQILDQRGVMAYKKRNYRKAIDYLDALEQMTGGLRRDLAILRAYAWLNAGDRVEARRQFTRLNGELSTKESRDGLKATQSD